MNRRAVPSPAFAAVLVLGLTVVAGCGGDEPSATPNTTVTPLATLPSSTLSTTPATTSPTTVPATTPAPAVAPTTPPTTALDPVAVGELSGDRVEITSNTLTAPFVMNRVGEYGSLQVYDGVSDGDGLTVRCVAITRSGDSGWSESCLFPGERSSFVYLDGIDPWIVDIGGEPGDVSLAQQPSDWAITSSGCTEPIVNLIAAAAIAPAVATEIACVGNEAFLTFGSVLMQDGPPDGGGLLLTYGDEGWNTDGGGTSFDCSTFPDGVDRCDTFGVESEMFESVSPIPSPELLPPVVDAVAVTETTSEIAAMAAGSTDVEAITQAVVAGVSQPDAEVAPTMIRHDGVGIRQLSLLIVDVPLMDDSAQSITHAVWIEPVGDTRPATVHRSYSWVNCARGVTEGLCV